MTLSLSLLAPLLFTHHKNRDIGSPLLLQTEHLKMVPHQVKIFIILLLVFQISEISADNSYKEGMELTYTSDHMIMKGRKLLMEVDTILDYQEPGANPGHEPRKGGGGGNRNGSP